MKRQILALILAAGAVLLTGCPNTETPKDIDNEKLVNTTDEERDFPESNGEKQESIDPIVNGEEPTPSVDDDPNQEPNDVGEMTSPDDQTEQNTGSQPPAENQNIITPADEPYEWEYPTENHVCEEPQVNPNTTTDAKPVIYLYPEETAEISVKLDYNGTFTTTYPAYNDGWKIISEPDGTISYNGREYYCLFWEGISNVDYSFEKGFCVKGEDTEKFLEDSLKKLGLTHKEANEFIIYWLPKMENNEFNPISFQEKLYTENAKLTVSPAPDTVIRVFMAWKGVDEFIEIEPQTLTAPERIGFTVVEWGGSELK